MSKTLETIVIKGGPSGRLIINRSEYDPEKHKLADIPANDASLSAAAGVTVPPSPNSEDNIGADGDSAGAMDFESLPYDEFRARAKLLGVTGKSREMILEKLRNAGHIV